LIEVVLDVSIEVGESELQSLASWVAGGLTAYDAAYLVLAEERGLELLIIDDEKVVAIAGVITRPLVSGPSSGG
jgi:predicted nucleic acid-binding protein